MSEIGIGIRGIRPVPDLLTPELIARFRAYLEDNPVWGSLHIVLSDCNFEDFHVQYVIDRAATEKDAEGLELARLLLRMNKTQRRKLSNLS